MVIVSPLKKNFMNHNFVFEDFEVNFLIIIIPFFMKLGFLKSSIFSDSETLFKYKEWLEIGLQEIITLVCSTIFPYVNMCVKFLHFDAHSGISNI